MKDFLNKLKYDINQNPALALAGAASCIAATAKLIESVAHFSGSRAFAKQVNHRIKVKTK